MNQVITTNSTEKYATMVWLLNSPPITGSPDRTGTVYLGMETIFRDTKEPVVP